MDRAQVEAILSGVPAGRRKVKAARPVISPDERAAQCMVALSRLAKRSGGDHRLQLTSSQLPPIF